MGLTCIFEAVRVQAGPVKLNISDAFFLLLLFSMLLSGYRGRIQIEEPNVARITRRFFIILLFCLNFISPIIDEFLFPSGIDGITPSIAYSVKTVVNILFFLLLLSLEGEDKNDFLSFFCKGFLCGIAIHIIYSIIQLAEWYLFGVDIHTPLMASFGITEEFLGGHPVLNYVVPPLVIRAAGFFWDPYFIGIMGCVAIFVSLTIRNVFLRNVSLITSFIVFVLSFSRTGYVALIATILLIPFISRYSTSFKERINSGKILKYSLVVFFVVTLSLPFVLDRNSREELSQGLKYKAEIKVDDEGDMRHLMYPVYSIKAVFHDPYHLLLGYGARNSSRGLYVSGNIPNEMNSAVSYDIESDWCKFLIDYGIVCFVVYLLFNISLIRALIRQGNFEESYVPLFLLITVLATFISGFFYTINDSRWVWLIYGAAIVYLNTDNEKQGDIC